MDKKIIHEQCIELLDMIGNCQYRISCIEHEVEFTYTKYFPTIKGKLEHDKEIKRMAIKRLELRYNNLIKQLCNSHG